jgi:hypothetical protein
MKNIPKYLRSFVFVEFERFWADMDGAEAVDRKGQPD